MGDLIINILKQLLKLLMPFLRPYLQQTPPRDRDLYMEEEPPETDPTELLNPQAFIDAARYLSENLEAYLRGTMKWGGGVFNGKRYNNFTLAERPGKYLKVLRMSSPQGWKKIGIINLNEATYLKHIAGKRLSTWCNMFVGAFTFSFLKAAGNPAGKRSLQIWDGDEWNANQLIENLRKGFYDTKNAKFSEIRADIQYAGIEVEEANRSYTIGGDDDNRLAEGMDYASRGGLVIVSLFLPGGTGHVAVLTGGEIDGEAEVANAGYRTALSMTLSKGFGAEKLRYLQYWKLIKNDGVI